MRNASIDSNKERADLVLTTSGAESQELVFQKKSSGAPCPSIVNLRQRHGNAFKITSEIMSNR